MDLDTVIENLNRTIEGKETLLETFRGSPDFVHKTVAHVLQINIDELKRIREDLLAVHKEIYQPRFENTYCSQCGGEFGPGDHGYSSCKEHRK